MNNCVKALAIAWLLLGCHNGLAAAEWVTHASAPGPDTAPTGESRFDELFRDDENRYRIPYPFSELLEFLESKVDNGDASGVRQVFLPIGRSLLRELPAPDFFRFPRAVIALQGEPAPGTGVLDYRLFIAHQPASASLEIISYNDAAGRFEFQVVEDYAPGLSPRVRQARRVMCLSCHQNAAPIFSMRPWSETNFNVAVATRLANALPERFESFIDTLTLDAGTIDLLAERANYLSVTQLVWQRGCSNADCRAAALRAVLQYRLSGSSNFARRHPAYLRDYFADLQQHWQRNWPDGLALGNSRIRDRDPFANAPLTRQQDALTLRPAHASWRDVDAIFADGVILRLAGFLTAADIRQIDRYLVQASRGKVALRQLQATCRLTHVAAATRLLECAGDAATPGLSATLEVEYAETTPTSMQLLALRLPGDRSILQPGIDALSAISNGLQANLVNPDHALSMRLADGNRLDAITLSWQAPSLRAENRLVIEIAVESTLLERALATLLNNHRSGNGDSLAARPFRRDAVMSELGTAIGLAEPTTAKPAAALAPLPLIDYSAAPVATSAELEGDLALLQPFCGQCHGLDTVNPPGFLVAANRSSRIRQCAPRILARLGAWHSTDDTAVVPMPPPATIDSDWVNSEHYRRLFDAISKVVDSGQDNARPVSVAAADYARLPPCRAD